MTRGWIVVTGRLPDEGPLQIGSVSLPAGVHIVSGYGTARQPVAWATTEPVPDTGRAWAALSQAHAQSGLVPFLLSGFDLNSAERPWDSGEFSDPADMTGLDHLDPAALLRHWWNIKTSEAEEGDEEPEGYEDDDFARAIAEDIAPFSRRQFPGLGPAEHHQLSAGQLDQVLAAQPPARVGLVPASRPADALPMLGWNPALDALPLAAVLRSWENRFGARLLRVGFAEISVLAQRPPRTEESAQRLAAEQWAFCDECAGQGLNDIPSITASLMSSPIWTFWWD
jgi:Domain of unknown function (DUF4253)